MAKRQSNLLCSHTLRSVFTRHNKPQQKEKDMKRRLFQFVVVSALSGGICLMPARAADELSKEDKAFLKEAAEAGTTEVELGKLAEKKGTSSGVKMLGEHLVKDHEKANGDLMALAKSK